MAATANVNVKPEELPLADSPIDVGTATEEEPTIAFTASKSVLETLGKSFSYEQESKNVAMMCRVYRDIYELFGGKLVWPEYQDLILPEREFEDFLDGFYRFLENMEEDVIDDTVSLLLSKRKHLDIENILTIIDQAHTSLIETEYSKYADFPISDLKFLLARLASKGEDIDLWREILLAVYGFSSIEELEGNNEMVDARVSEVKKRVENSDLHRRARAYHHNILSQKRAKLSRKSKRAGGRKSIWMTEIVLTGAAAIFTVWLVSKFLKSH